MELNRIHCLRSVALPLLQAIAPAQEDLRPRMAVPVFPSVSEDRCYVSSTVLSANPRSRKSLASRTRLQHAWAYRPGTTS